MAVNNQIFYDTLSVNGPCKKVEKQKRNSANSVPRQQISVNRKKTVGIADEAEIVLKKNHWACKLKICGKTDIC